MKKAIFVAATLLTVLAIASCEKEEKIKYAEDGETPLPKAVDLGLSVKWASFNLGASNEYQTGDYYSWGETKTKYVYTYGTYIYNAEFPEKLAKSKDVARKKLGYDWRMPTKKEFEELIQTMNDDDYEWTAETGKDRNGDEILKGWRIKSIRGKTKGNNIFFPAAGFMHSVPGYKDNMGFYWTSDIYQTYNYNAWTFTFGEDENTVGITHDSNRAYGLSIRPVYLD